MGQGFTQPQGKLRAHWQPSPSLQAHRPPKVTCQLGDGRSLAPSPPGSTAARESGTWWHVCFCTTSDLTVKLCPQREPVSTHRGASHRPQTPSRTFLCVYLTVLWGSLCPPPSPGHR